MGCIMMWPICLSEKRGSHFIRLHEAKNMADTVVTALLLSRSCDGPSCAIR
jgi:hypothetical protein